MTQQEQELLLKLNPEELSLALKCVAGKIRVSRSLPESLLELSPDQWVYLEHLLQMLQEERSLTRLH